MTEKSYQEQEPTPEEKADEIRRKYRYRSMILKEQVSMPVEEAVKLVGRDTAYHLYRKI